jgi:hypothetical protein
MAWIAAIADVFIAGVRKPRAAAIDFISGFTYAYNETTGRHEITGTGGGGGGTGDVAGPASSVDQRVPVFSGITGKLLAQSSFLISDLIKRNGGTVFTADQSMGGFKLTSLGTPTDATDAATKAYVDAAAGGGISGIPMTFFASTVDGDPGAGGIRLSHATPASAVSMFVDDVEAADGTNIRDLIAALANVIGAQVRLQSKSADENWIVYKVGSYTSATGYGKLTGLTVVDSSTTVTFPTTAGDLILSIDIGQPKDLGNQSLTNARCITYAAEVDNGNSGAADTVDWTAGQTQKSTLTGNCTFAFTAPPGVCGLSLKLIQDATGSRTVTWPGSVIWVGGSAPTLSTAPAAVDIISLYYDGTNYYGSTGSAALPAGTLGDALSYNGTAWISTSIFLSSKTLSKSSADAVGATLVLRKSRGTPGAPTAHNADDVLGEYIAQGHDGSAYFNAGRIRWVAKAAGGTKKTSWMQTWQHDGTAERVIQETCVEEFSSSGDGDNTRFTIAIANDEQVTVRFRVRGVGPTNKHIWRDHVVTYRRVGAGAPAKIAETFIVPLNNTDDADWSIDYSISGNNLLLTDNGETATAITWKWRVTVERD